MLNQNLLSYPKIIDFIGNELLYSLTNKKYLLNKNHTTSTGITQFFRDVNRINYLDEDDTTEIKNWNTQKIFESNNIAQVNGNESLIRADDYRDKIARRVLNNYCYNKVNKIIKGTINKKFKKLPQDILINISRKKK